MNRPSLRAPALKTALLQPEGAFERVEVIDSTGSTNADLAAAAADTAQRWPDLSVLIANGQEAGRGRLGRTWVVPAGAAMISSVLLRPTASRHPASAFAPTGYAWLSILSGIALCRAVQSVAGVPAELKWPNDVVAGGRKLAGILAQVVPAGPDGTGPAVVVGAGLNVDAQRSELPTGRATSLLLEGAGPAGLDRNVLLPAYLNGFAALYAQFLAAGGDAEAPLGGAAGAPTLVELATGHMGTVGREVRAELPGGVILTGTATALASDGSLLLRDAGGTFHTVSAGDVVHLRRTDPDGTVRYA